MIFLEGNDAGLYTSSNTTLCRGFTCLPKVHLLCHTCVAQLVLSQGIIAVQMHGSEESNHTATEAGDWVVVKERSVVLALSKLTVPQPPDRPIGVDEQGCAGSRLPLRPYWLMWLGWWCDEVQASPTKLTRAYSGNRTLN